MHLSNLTQIPFYVIEIPCYFKETLHHHHKTLIDRDIIKDNYLDLIFVFGILASCTLLTCCQKLKKKPSLIYVEAEDVNEKDEVDKLHHKDSHC